MTMSEKNNWQELLALSTIIFDVCSTIAWYKDSGHSTVAILSQSQASGAWSHYQAKSLKSYLYEINREKLILELKSLEPNKVAATADYQLMISDYASKISQYEQDKKEAESKAKALEQTRDKAQLYSDAFGMSMMAFQIAIVLSSLASLLDKAKLWYLSLAAGAVGLVYFANGWCLFF